MKNKQDYDILSIIGFSLSVLSIILPFLVLLGLIFSILGLSRTRNNEKKGRELAIVGTIVSSIILIILVIVLILLGTFAYILLSNITQKSLEFNSNCLEKGNEIQIKINSEGQEENICISSKGEDCKEEDYLLNKCEIE